MGFIMDGLDAEAYDRTYTDRQLVGRIFRYFRPETSRILVVAAAIVLTSLVDTGLPIYISHSLDQLQQNPAGVNLLLTGGIITALACASWLFNFVRRSLAARTVGNVVLQLREDAFD